MKMTKYKITGETKIVASSNDSTSIGDYGTRSYTGMNYELKDENDNVLYSISWSVKDDEQYYIINDGNKTTEVSEEEVPEGWDLNDIENDIIQNLVLNHAAFDFPIEFENQLEEFGFELEYDDYNDYSVDKRNGYGINYRNWEITPAGFVDVKPDRIEDFEKLCEKFGIDYGEVEE